MKALLPKRLNENKDFLIILSNKTLGQILKTCKQLFSIFGWQPICTDDAILSLSMSTTKYSPCTK